ncbi:MAG TPA: hypothetical protein VFN67_07045 [Polyangiales bacterium]|nr:hypothetical protein [Polyangiales bacterium]
MSELEIIDEGPFLRLLAPPWWNLLARYRRWRLLRSLRTSNQWAYFAPSDAADGSKNGI